MTTAIASLIDGAKESEKALAGIFLVEPERFAEAGVSASSFGVPALRKIVDATAAVIASGDGSADVTLVCEELRRRGQLREVGGVAFVASLLEGLPRKKVSLRGHREQVERMARRRKLAAIAERLAASAYDVADDPEAIARRTLADLAEIEHPADQDLVPLSDIEAQPVNWLWGPYLALGMLGMISGDPGCGKTYLSLAIAAALSVGKIPASGELCEPVSTVYLSRENDPARVIRPRFDGLKGDPSRFHLLGQRTQVTLGDIARLDAALRQTGAKLLVVDPLQSYLGADVDAHRANETRPILDALAALAAERGCCVLLLRHLAKSNGGRAIHRGMGSIDFTGAVRTEMLAGSAPDDPQTLALVMLKSNLGEFGQALAYTIDGHGFTWTGETTLRAADVLSAEGLSPADDGEQREIREWLREQLSAGPVPSRDLLPKDGSGKFREAAVRRGLKQIGAVARQPEGKKSGGWWWFLPEVAKSDERDKRDSVY